MYDYEFSCHDSRDCYFTVNKSMNSGPDQILPAKGITTVNPDEPVSLRIPESGKAIETTPPISVPGLLKRTLDAYPNHPALAYKANGKWNKITYK